MRAAIAVGVAVALLGLDLAPAHAGSFNQSIGAGRSMTSKGLIVTYQSLNWPSGDAYRPLQVTITPTAPLAADHTLTFEMQLTAYAYSRQTMRIRYDVDVPAGSTGVTAQWTAPEYLRFNASAVDVYVDGRHDPKLSLSNLGFNWPEDAMLRAVFLVDSPAARDAAQSMITAIDPSANNNRPYYGNPNSQLDIGIVDAWHSAATVGNVAGAPIVPALKLPERWIDYSGLDLVAIPIDRLEDLRQAQPEAWHALRDWAATGGTLWVNGLAEGAAGADRLEKALDLPPLPFEAAKPNVAREKAAISAFAWNKPDSRQFGKSTIEILPDSRNYGQASSNGPIGTSQVKATDEPFHFRTWQRGMIFAFAGGAPYDDTRVALWAFNSLDPNLLWRERHGLSMSERNLRYWDFLIPGVGEAPVVAFWGLITIFVLAIGPATYVLLRRAKRLHYMLLITPAAAAAITLSLFAYAVMADGLGARVRARSVTLIDQTTGQTVCWSRLSYFAGLAPRNGLEFSSDVCVLPFLYEPTDESGGSSKQWELGDAQYLTTGWLPGRVPRQYLTVRSHATALGLDVKPGTPTGPDAAPEVVNRLGAAVRELYLRLDDNRIYRAKNIGLNQPAKLEPIDDATWARDLMKIGIADQQTRIGPTIDPDAHGIWGQRRFGSGSTFTATGLLDGTVDSLSRVASERSTPLRAPRSYIALVEISPEVELGTPQAKLVTGDLPDTHLILGRW